MPAEADGEPATLSAKPPIGRVKHRITGQHFVDRTGVRETGRPNGPPPVKIDSALLN